VRANSHLYKKYMDTLKTYVGQCKDEVNYQKYNCAILKSLIGLDLNKISQMTLEQQSYLYTQLVRVHQAPYT
ncbi:hypothetical protein, partial [Photobacterium sp. R1]